MDDDEHSRPTNDPVPSSGESGAMANPDMRGTPRILIVESIRSTRELMRLVLDRHYQTQTAATYEQALRRVRTTQFDAIVIGVNLQGVEAGAELIEELRAAGEGATVPIIAMVGPSGNEARERLAAAGADDFLRMPFVRSDLVDLLENTVDDGHPKSGMDEGNNGG